MNLKNKKILFLSPYPKDKAPSQRLKYEQYFPAFRDAGMQIEDNSFMPLQLWSILYKKGFFFKKFFFTFIGYLNRYILLFQIPKYDIIYVHLWGTPFGMPFYEKILRRLSKRLIYDIDDMIFLKDTNDANKITKILKGRKKSLFLMKHADHVITCTKKLDDFARQFNKNTTNISSTVDTINRYTAREDYDIKGEFVIGWSGSYTTARFLAILSETFKKLSKQIEFKLIVLGDASFQIEGVNIEALEWKEKIEMPTLRKFDVGLYPLVDEPWVYGKSGLKAIQYMALGIPTIATGVGANFNIIKDGENGFLIPPEDYNLWINRIIDLYNDKQLRIRIGKAGRETIVSNYSIEKNKSKYLQAIGDY
ncbi:MAG: glycosyltransferase [Chitinophagales bacterium]|nr:glycosyltransferase [Chitinophagales bacterium]